MATTICLSARLLGRGLRVQAPYEKLYFIVGASFSSAAFSAQEASHNTGDGSGLLTIACTLLAMLAIYLYVLLKRERQARRADTARLAEREQAAEDAVRANDQKNRFLERMSNAFRTPLNVILGFAQLQQSRLDPNASADVRRGTEATLTAGWQMLELLDDIVDIVRLERGTLALRVDDCALDEVISHAIGLVRDEAGAAGVRLEFEPAHLGVRADYNRLKQVLVNLLKNAVQYNRAGGSVRISVEPGDNQTVLCRLTDSGVGIEPEDREQVFNSFARTSIAEELHPEGTGLGLSMARFLCEAMDGTLTLEDDDGEGTQFSLSLPAASAKSADPPRRADATRPVPPTRPLTAVYVEDHRASLELMQAIMAPLENVKLLTASTAEHGIQLVREHKPDLVLLDINLVGMDGIDAARTIKADPELCNIPLVALSADAEEPQIRAALEAGFTEYLTKPLDIEQLWRLLESLTCGNPPSSE